VAGEERDDFKVKEGREHEERGKKYVTFSLNAAH